MTLPYTHLDLERLLEPLEEKYSELPRFLNEFQVVLPDGRCYQPSIASDIPAGSGVSAKTNSKPSSCPVPSITVFKRKNLKQLPISNDFYNHNLSNPELDLRDAGKSKVSCVRCRKFKKKCSRILPECANCSGSDQLCVYLPRKLKRKTLEVRRASIEPSVVVPKRLSLPNMAIGSPSVDPKSNYCTKPDTSSTTGRKTAPSPVNLLSPSYKKRSNDLGLILN